MAGRPHRPKSTIRRTSFYSNAPHPQSILFTLLTLHFPSPTVWIYFDFNNRLHQYHLLTIKPRKSPEHTKTKLAEILTDEFPIVNCNPFAVVLFPYRGVFAGSQLYGSPTIT